MMKKYDIIYYDEDRNETVKTVEAEKPSLAIERFRRENPDKEIFTIMQGGFKNAGKHFL